MRLNNDATGDQWRTGHHGSICVL